MSRGDIWCFALLLLQQCGAKMYKDRSMNFFVHGVELIFKCYEKTRPYVVVTGI